LEKLPTLPEMNVPIPEPKNKLRKKKKVLKSPKYIDSSPEKLSPKYNDDESPQFERDEGDDINFYDQPEDNKE
jgi:hypothetical protein